MDGPVFISYSRDDKKRIEGLVNYLSDSGIPVWWDNDLEAGQVFPKIIPNIIDKASSVIVAWSQSSVDKDWVIAEAEQGRQRKILVPITLDDNIKVPAPFGIYHSYDFTDSDFLKGNEVKKLLKTLRSVLKTGRPIQTYQRGISDDSYTIKNVLRASNEVRELVKKLGSLAEIMTLEAKPVEDIKRALKEVEKTYEVVNKSIIKFLSAINQKTKLSINPFVEMERGSLEQLIKKGHGHCTLILTHYSKLRGLRDSVKSQISAKQLKELDDIFVRLGTADGDLFQEMTAIGNLLTNEARIILNLLLTGQEKIVRNQIKDDRLSLAPIEKNMNKAFLELQKVSQTIGAVI